ncbi:pheromone-binding protein Gp-9-like isoform X2 [Odontomachus brunneus]|nr:pheromone-binding protein Gp-9-like isoform X2 [Odontomachus brunneus]XP_032689808.1 pheromone-binding protein Gp-9-like isoform X2 [Odontomachus brunneus]
MTKEEVQTCFNKANVTLDDLMKIDEISEDRLQTMDFDDSALKAGCFFACLYQKKAMIIGAPVNMDQIKEIIHSDKGIEPNLLAKILQIHDTCANQVKSITNECKKILKYILCSRYEMERTYYQ